MNMAKDQYHDMILRLLGKQSKRCVRDARRAGKRCATKYIFVRITLRILRTRGSPNIDSILQVEKQLE